MTSRWYVVHVYSGFEAKVAQSVREQASKMGLSDVIEDIQVPSEEVIQVRRGVKVSSDRKFFPGYVLVKMEMVDEAWHLIKRHSEGRRFFGECRQTISNF